MGGMSSDLVVNKFSQSSSISHHHGVGKHRKDFLLGTIGETGMKTLRALKASFDPNNIFAANNLIDI